MLGTLNRRTFIHAGLAVGFCACSKTLPNERPERSDIAAELAKIEQQVGGRVGVFAFSPTFDAPVVAFRADERFAMCSTFKWALVAQVLWLVDQGRLKLSTELPFAQQDVQEYAPVAQAAWAQGKRQMSIEAWCEAAVTLSDNTAANVLLAQVGGPSGVTAFFARVGDPLTHLDRVEPELNSNLLGDVRDTTTPRAMATALAATLTTNALSLGNRDKLAAWLIASPTGKERLRAGFPAELRIGDKTGTGNNGACNNVAVVWRPNGEPLVVAAYLSESTGPLAELLAVHRQIGTLCAQLV